MAMSCAPSRSFQKQESDELVHGIWDRQLGLRMRHACADQKTFKVGDDMLLKSSRRLGPIQFSVFWKMRLLREN